MALPPMAKTKINYLIVVQKSRLLIFIEIENLKVKFKGMAKNFQTIDESLMNPR
jgi:hypothetical protein